MIELSMFQKGKVWGRDGSQVRVLVGIVYYIVTKVFNCDAPFFEGLADHRQPAETCVSHIMSKSGHVGPIHPYSSKYNQLYYNSFKS